MYIKKPLAEMLPVIIDLQLIIADTLPQDTTTPPQKRVMITIICEVLSVIACFLSVIKEYHGIVGYVKRFIHDR